LFALNKAVMGGGLLDKGVMGKANKGKRPTNFFDWQAGCLVHLNKLHGFSTLFG